MPKLVDSHCHLNFESLSTRLPEVLEQAREHHVAHMLCVSVTLEKFPEILALARAHPQISASVGVHPNERDGVEPTAAELTALAKDPSVVAIGETGLDYYRSQGDMAWQHERFRQHIRAAKSCDKPLIVHTRAAAADTMRILKEEGAQSVRGVMHCFTENWAVAKQALDLDFFISFAGILTFKNAADLREVARQIPPERLLIETDSPYLAPVPYRGKVNEPAYVKYVAECLADIRKISLTEIAEQTTGNFFSLFRHAQATS